MDSAPDRLQKSRKTPGWFRTAAPILLICLVACHPVLADAAGPKDPAEIETEDPLPFYARLSAGLFLMAWWVNHWNLFVFRM